MKTKLAIVGLIWLVPIGCWLGVPVADRDFAVVVGSLFAFVTSVFVVWQPMLRCGACGAATGYFDNYTTIAARLHANWRRYFVCRSCGTTIDRMTGMPAAGYPETPVTPASSRSDIGCGISGFGGLLILGSLVIGAVAVVEIFGGAGQPGRAELALLGCFIAAIVGLGLVWAGWLFFSR